MTLKIIVATLALLSFGCPAVAGPAPQLSGRYALTYQENCEYIHNGPTVVAAGTISNAILIGTFNARTGTYHATSVHVSGALLVKGTTTGMSQFTQTQTAPFATTASTIMINGITYQAVFSAVEHGVALRGFFVGNTTSNPGISPANDCAGFGSFERMQTITGP